jgi:hypothetical protein
MTPPYQDCNSVATVLEDTCGRHGLEDALADPAIGSARPAAQREAITP